MEEIGDELVIKLSKKKRSRNRGGHSTLRAFLHKFVLFNHFEAYIVLCKKIRNFQISL